MNAGFFYGADINEKPLDNLTENGGFCAIFRTIACIGDSLSSGAFESTADDGRTQCRDYFAYSWGQFIARMTGSKVYNFSQGGMTAREYCENFADDHGYWDKEKSCQAYIIALGNNDLMYYNVDVGSFCDICYEDWQKNADTFIGNYAKIIQRYKEISPDAKFFLVSMPHGDEDTEYPGKIEMFQKIMHGFAERFSNTYVIDLCEYGPVYSGDFRKNLFMGGHMNPMGYMFTAKMIASYIDYIIRHNPKDFAQVGFIGTPYKNRNAD
ncbi:MAG: SGNH/GDSL hydrolase family protein [Eubacteriales bacterium]